MLLPRSCVVSRGAERARALDERERRVEQSVRGGKAAEALRLALADPPFASKDAALKSRSHAVVMRAILALKEAEVASALGELSLDAADALMKHVVRGLATPESSGVLLRLHASVVERFGQGAGQRGWTLVECYVHCRPPLK